MVMNIKFFFPREWTVMRFYWLNSLMLFNDNITFNVNEQHQFQGNKLLTKCLAFSINLWNYLGNWRVAFFLFNNFYGETSHLIRWNILFKIISVEFNRIQFKYIKLYDVQRILFYRIPYKESLITLTLTDFFFQFWILL